MRVGAYTSDKYNAAAFAIVLVRLFVCSFVFLTLSLILSIRPFSRRGPPRLALARVYITLDQHSPYREQALTII